MKQKKICIVIGSAMNLHSLYKDQFKFLMNNGYEVTGIAPSGIEHEWLRVDGIKTKIIFLKRTPSPIYDLISVLQLSYYFLFHRFNIISISTPKASLVGAISALVTFHKNIIYTQRGRVYENLTGFKRQFYELLERFVFKISKRIFCISHELMEDFIKNKFCSPEKIFVINSGSSNGVDLNIFTLNDKLRNEGAVIRKKLKLNKKDLLILYSGRIRKEKGINELVSAFKNLSKNYNNIYLLIQGKYEEYDLLNETVEYEIKSNSKIFIEPWSRNVEKYFAAADIFAFPSHREGFGNVALEASAMELPVVGFNVIGVRESVRDGYSGILYKNISPQSLEHGLKRLISNPILRKELGQNGRKRIEHEFDSKIIWNELLKKYDELAQL